MSSAIRIVPDTSLLVAGALKQGYAYNFLLAEDDTIPPYIIFTSAAILLELQEKLERLGLQRVMVVQYLDDISKVSQIVLPTQKLTVVRDPDDDKILECAVEAKADLIVSFDKDLLDLKEYGGIKIDHPRMLKYWFSPKQR